MDCRIWLPPFLAYCDCAVPSSCFCYTTSITKVLRCNEFSYLTLQFDYLPLGLSFKQFGFYPHIHHSHRTIQSQFGNYLTYGLSRHATLPVRFLFQISRAMIGFSKNTYLIACNSYIYLFSLYGRTVLHHIGSRRRRVDNIVGRVDDALRNVGRVNDRPLCACLSHHQQEQADCHDCFCSHFLLLD